MIKFIIPAIIIFLTILFWDKINKVIYKKFKITDLFQYVINLLTDAF